MKAAKLRKSNASWYASWHATRDVSHILWIYLTEETVRNVLKRCKPSVHHIREDQPVLTLHVQFPCKGQYHPWIYTVPFDRNSQKHTVHWGKDDFFIYLFILFLCFCHFNIRTVVSILYTSTVTVASMLILVVDRLTLQTDTSCHHLLCLINIGSYLVTETITFCK